MLAVIHYHTTRAVDAHDELLEVAVCVCASNRSLRYVEQEKVPPRHERKLIAELRVGEGTSRIRDDRNGHYPRAMRGEHGKLSRSIGGRSVPTLGGVLTWRAVLTCTVRDTMSDASGIPGHNDARRHVVRDDRTGADHRPLADLDPGEQGRVRANRRTCTHGGSREAFRVLAAPREGIVRERHVRPDEHVILESDAVPQLYAALHGHAVSDHDVVLDEHVVADVAVTPDDGAGKHVRERPDARARANTIRLHDCLRMPEVRLLDGRHCSLAIVAIAAPPVRDSLATRIRYSP
jgi:hypothetical protein